MIMIGHARGELPFVLVRSDVLRHVVMFAEERPHSHVSRHHFTPEKYTVLTYRINSFFAQSQMTDDAPILGDFGAHYSAL